MTSFIKELTMTCLLWPVLGPLLAGGVVITKRIYQQNSNQRIRKYKAVLTLNQRDNFICSVS